MLRFSCTRKYNELTVVYSSVCMFCIKSCMSCTNTCLRRKREITYLSVVLPGLKSIHFFFSFFKPETRNKRKDRDCPCEIPAWLKYHRVVECSTVIGQSDLSLGETTVIFAWASSILTRHITQPVSKLSRALWRRGRKRRERPGMLVRRLKSPVPHNLTEFVNKGAVEVEIASS